MALVFAVGCGEGDADSASQRWINEVTLVNGGFVETSEAAQAEIISASTAEELSQTYSAYAAALREQSDRLAAIDTPDECAKVETVIVGFIDDIASITEDLSKQQTLTAIQLKRLESQIETDRQGLLRAFRPILQGEHC